MSEIVWFSPSVINFSKIQLTSFLLPELNNLRMGCYPTEPDEYTTYINGARVIMTRSSYEKSGRKQVNHTAPFIVAAEIAAEIDSRLKMCPNGWWVQSYYTDGFTFQEIAKFNHTTEEWVKREINRMVRYITGWKRRRDKDTHESIDYIQWLQIQSAKINVSLKASKIMSSP